MVIVAFGLLGAASLQSKTQVSEIESYQRVQAVLLMSDIRERINANRAQAAGYVSTSIIGTGDNQPTSCTNLATGVNRDLCEWSNALKGAAEQKSSANVGSMIGARGCITQVQAANPTSGLCTPGIYQITVAWQGMHQTIAPALSCGQGLYGADDSYRRAVSTQIAIGLPSC